MKHDDKIWLAKDEISSLPKHGVQYTVQLTMDCDFFNATYQAELFNY